MINSEREDITVRGAQRYQAWRERLLTDPAPRALYEEEAAKKALWKHSGCSRARWRFSAGLR
jgi:hypothetical protein